MYRSVLYKVVGGFFISRKVKGFLQVWIGANLQIKANLKAWIPAERIFACDHTSKLAAADFWKD